MTLILASASALTRVVACPDSERLTPIVVSAPTKDSRRGDTIHVYIRTVGGGIDRDEALAAVPEDDEHRAACVAFDVTAIPRGGHFEVALAWNHRTGVGRVLGYDLDRDYSGADRSVEYVGSFDYAAELSPVHGVLADWKSGWNTIPARRSWQLRIGAVAAAATWGWQRVTTAHLDVRDPWNPRWDKHEMDELELAAARAELRALAAVLAEERPPERFVEGEHCRYCPAFNACPAKTGLMRQMVAMVAVRDGVGGQLVTPENAAAMWNRLDEYDVIAKRLRTQAQKLAEHVPIDLGNGYELRMAPGDARDKVIDAGKAIDFLRSHADGEAAKAATTTTKGALAEAIKAWARRVGAPVGATEKQMLAELRTLGAVSKEPGETKVREVRKG